MLPLARISLVLVVILVAVSAYLRLHHAGIGCPDFPACYGLIGAPDEGDSGPVASAYQRIVSASDAPLAWAQPLHRLVASVLGLCILFLTLSSLKARRHRLVCLALLLLTVWLAYIGLQSGSLHSTAIVMGNLAGGFAMTGLLGWLVLGGHERQPTAPRTGPRALAWAALWILVIQILLGGFTSANFAALACPGLPDCAGGYLPGEGLGTALRFDRVVEVSEYGLALGGDERQAIHKAHRIGAVLTLAVVLAAAFAAMRHPGTRALSLVIALFVLAEFGVGLAAIVTDLPIQLAVAHNWLAALLLLALIRLAAQKPAA